MYLRFHGRKPYCRKSCLTDYIRFVRNAWITYHCQGKKCCNEARKNTARDYLLLTYSFPLSLHSIIIYLCQYFFPLSFGAVCQPYSLRTSYVQNHTRQWRQRVRNGFCHLVSQRQTREQMKHNSLAGLYCKPKLC